MDSKTKIVIGILIVGIILIGGWWIWKNHYISIQSQESTTQSAKISVDENLEAIVDIQLPIEKTEAETIVKEFCESKNPSYAYKYNMIKEIDNKWRVPIINVNCLCYALVNKENGETNCMECNCTELSSVFETEKVTIATDKTEYVQGDTAEITLKNDRNAPIYIDLESYNYNYKIYLEEYESGSWKASNYNFAQRIKCAPGGQGPAIGCLEIEGKNTNKRSVRLSYQICAGGKEPYWETGKFPKAKYIDLPKGKYRLKIYVKEKCDGEEDGSIYSNKFTIK